MCVHIFENQLYSLAEQASNETLGYHKHNQPPG